MTRTQILRQSCKVDSLRTAHQTALLKYKDALVRHSTWVFFKPDLVKLLLKVQQLDAEIIKETKVLLNMKGIDYKDEYKHYRSGLK